MMQGGEKKKIKSKEMNDKQQELKPKKRCLHVSHRKDNLQLESQFD